MKISRWISINVVNINCQNVCHSRVTGAGGNLVPMCCQHSDLYGKALDAFQTIKYFPQKDT